MNKRFRWMLVVLVVSAAVALARPGFARLFSLPASGQLTIRNGQRNEVWRPCVLSVICGEVASRTVSVYRVNGDLEYPIAQRSATAASYVYEFEAHYWTGLMSGVKVVVTPACTGLVEVIYE